MSKNYVQISSLNNPITKASVRSLHKRYTDCEWTALKALLNEGILNAYIPEAMRIADTVDGQKIEIEDMTAPYNYPAVVDIKLGFRDFSESECSSKVPRKDLYDQLVSSNPFCLGPEDHIERKICQQRFNQEIYNANKEMNKNAFQMMGMKCLGKESEAERGIRMKTSTPEKTLVQLKTWFEDRKSAAPQVKDALEALRTCCMSSEMFMNYEMVGVSVLIMFDERQAAVALIDFEKAMPANRRVSHNKEWEFGNKEDGFLRGLDNVINMVEACCN